MSILLKNRMLTSLHLLIREYALIIREDEDETKAQIKRDLNIESFADVGVMELARASAYVENKIKRYGKN